jgi:hypothetical protein
MLVCEAHVRYIQNSISRTKFWKVLEFKNFVKNYGHISFTASDAIEALELSVSMFNWDNENVK